MPCSCTSILSATERWRSAKSRASLIFTSSAPLATICSALASDFAASPMLSFIALTAFKKRCDALVSTDDEALTSIVFPLSSAVPCSITASCSSCVLWRSARSVNTWVRRTLLAGVPIPVGSSGAAFSASCCAFAAAVWRPSKSALNAARRPSLMPRPMALPLPKPLDIGLTLGTSAPARPIGAPSNAPPINPPPIAAPVCIKLYLSCKPIFISRDCVPRLCMPSTRPPARASEVAPFVRPARIPAFLAWPNAACVVAFFTL